MVLYHKAFGSGLAGYGRRLTVRFLQSDPMLASARLRNIIPARELSKRGWAEGNDILVASKDNWTWTDNIKRQFGAVVFDVCDDWFSEPSKREHYRHVCAVADLVTCNSETMRERIREETGRDAVVIDDPWEHDEKPAGAGDGVLWFGQAKGLDDLYECADRIAYPLTVVSDYPASWSIPWSEMVQAEALNACRCVIVPPTKRKARSANKAITAIRAGRMVVAGDIPAYREIPGIYVDDDFVPNLDQAMNEDMTDRIRVAQRYVADRYSPERIADQWEAAFDRL